MYKFRQTLCKSTVVVNGQALGCTSCWHYRLQSGRCSLQHSQSWAWVSEAVSITCEHFLNWMPKPLKMAAGEQRRMSVSIRASMLTSHQRLCTDVGWHFPGKTNVCGSNYCGLVNSIAKRGFLVFGVCLNLNWHMMEYSDLRSALFWHGNNPMAFRLQCIL